MEKDFCAIPVGWMADDVEKAIKAGANFLAALGLVAYTEALGREVLRTQGVPDPGNQPAFYHFADMMGYRVEILKDAKAYDRFRNGLVHEYYIKGNTALIVVDFAEGVDPSGARPGLELNPDGTPVAFVLCPYLRDFKRSAGNWFAKREAYRTGAVPLPPGGTLPDFPTQPTSAQFYIPPAREDTT